MNVNALNDGTKSGTLGNLAQYLRFLACASEDPELCDPGLHQAILIASQTAALLEQKQSNCAVEVDKS